jgi:opacity protein-like surface antigen
MNFKRLAPIVLAALVSGAAAFAAQTTAVKASRANLRAEPATTARVVATLRKGAALEIVERTGEWLKVVAKEGGQEGYIHQALVGVPEATPDAVADDAGDDATDAVTERPVVAERAPTGVAPSAARDEAEAMDAPDDEDGGARLTLIVNGLFGPLANSFDETRSIRMFAEDGAVESDYSAKGGPGVDVGLQYRLSPRLGVIASFVSASRKTENTYTARLPHPLYLNKHRIAEGTLSDLSYAETAGHLSLAYLGDAGSLGYTLFAGPSFYSLDVELVERADTREDYPFDDVTVTLPTAKQKKSGAGFHLGAGLAYHLSPRVDLGLQARYGVASLSFEPKEGDTTDVKAGGLQIGAGIRFAF